jgi:hypothetical protein
MGAQPALPPRVLPAGQRQQVIMKEGPQDPRTRDVAYPFSSLFLPSPFYILFLSFPTSFFLLLIFFLCFSNCALSPYSCEDYSPNCAQWAEDGECSRNPVFMVGDLAGTGQCRKACGAC